MIGVKMANHMSPHGWPLLEGAEVRKKIIVHFSALLSLMLKGTRTNPNRFPRLITKNREKPRNFLESRSFWGWVEVGWVGLGWAGLGFFEYSQVLLDWVGNWVERFLNKIKDD